MDRMVGRVKHGVTAYKRNICRCKKCREANTDYERKKRHQRREYQRKRPVLPFYHDTMTLAEYKKFREVE